ncbi:MAG: hypothetical protein AUH19_09345 [Verrucomicrobia bacterium 13_2_20CM_55_10]|nr:MAG: hypothetical protein AUH19_09345 [Verrucomicrobia bacterium 13_2_20CM_55_10]
MNGVFFRPPAAPPSRLSEDRLLSVFLYRGPAFGKAPLDSVLLYQILPFRDHGTDMNLAWWIDLERTEDNHDAEKI